MDRETHLRPITPEDPREIAYAKIERAIRQAQHARRSGVKLKSVIPLPTVEEIPYGSEGFDVHNAISANADFYEELMDPETITRKNKKGPFKKGLFAKHIVEGQLPIDEDVRLRVTTARPNIVGMVTDSRFEASAHIEVKKKRRHKT